MGVLLITKLLEIIFIIVYKNQNKYTQFIFLGLRTLFFSSWFSWSAAGFIFGLVGYQFNIADSTIKKFKKFKKVTWFILVGAHLVVIRPYSFLYAQCSFLQGLEGSFGMPRIEPQVDCI